jgi:iron complex outermembrane receptor protein
MIGLSKFSTLLLSATSLVALASTAANAQTGTTPETVVVTGSRITADAANSPTPVTIVSVEQLLATTPTDVADGLNKLPVFQGSAGPRSGNNASSDATGNVLNLRNFGAQRTLILFDGHRVAPSNNNGTVDTDILPEMLMSRVDVVTGGASAVYGSDAVTGVVNFILNKNFTGFKADASAGISNYGDGMNYKLGLAGGDDLFGGRGHWEATIRYQHQDPVSNQARPYGLLFFGNAGLGTAASPYYGVFNLHNTTRTAGGLVTCTSCSVSGQQFSADGVLTPFTLGTPTGTSGTQSGGDGSQILHSSAIAGLRTAQSFARFSYDLSNDVSFYVDATAAEAWNWNQFVDDSISAAAHNPNTFFKNNPFLSPANQALLGNNGTNLTTNTFTLTKVFQNQGSNGDLITQAEDRNLGVTTGFDGTFRGYDWDIFYTHGHSRQTVSNVNNENNQNLYAAEDAVVNSSGQVSCYATTPAAGAAANAAYAGCVPINPFGPTATTPSQYQYVTGKTQFHQTFVLDNVGGSITGALFDLPAGPVKAALSGEARWLDFTVTSNALPTSLVNCTGLRLCDPAALLWAFNTVAPASASQSVYEGAVEADVPLLKDVPFFQTLDVNMAGRYTDYSTSGSVETWKVGLDWHVNDDFRFRATNSIDIRAPTPYDLFQPVSQSVSAYTDQLTATGGNTIVRTSGNPNLVPEVARTYTVGIVLTPTFIPNLTASVDTYKIGVKNAIGSLAGTSTTVQALCMASAPAYNSSYCSLYIRPLPYPNTTPANYPTAVLSSPLNAAVNTIEGLDLDITYSFAGDDVWSGMPGNFTLRNLETWQPVNESQQFAGAPFTYSNSPKVRMTWFAGYNVDDWKFNVEDRWLSGFPQRTTFTVFYNQPRINHYNQVDFTVTKTINAYTVPLDAYVSISNLLNTNPPLTTGGSSGEYYGAPADEDVMGRFFTIGVRTNL